MADITQLLRRARDGDDESLKAVFEQLYNELHHIAVARLRRAAGTLTPTVLVHEAFERLMGSRQLALNDRRHFFSCAARAMRMIVVDHARRASAQKRTPDPVSLTLTDDASAVVNVLDLDRALTELEQISERARELVGLRYFVGLTMRETADVLEISLRTANREWDKARAFLHTRMRGGN